MVREMKSFADWTQDIAESNNMEPEPDTTDHAAEGAGNLLIVWVTCPSCGFDFLSSEYANHVAAVHAGPLGRLRT